jgi:protein gp37
LRLMSMKKTKIEWTECTWNPTTGCTKVSLGCQNCYAEKMAYRLRAMGQPNYINGFYLTLQLHTLMLPLSWKKPKVIFVNSMSDLFHKDVPDEYILKVFKVMNKAHWHVFQVLTKRSARLKQISKKLPWSKNIWMGVTVEHPNYKYRISDLKEVSSKVKFISFEPLLGRLGSIALQNIDWAIVGGESGPGARPMLKEWVVDIRKQCERDNVSFFFKQWGGVNKKKTGRELDGRYWDEVPEYETMLV